MTHQSSPSPTPPIATESPMPQRGGGGRGRFPRGGGRGRGGRDGRGGSTGKNFHSLDHADRTRERYRNNYIDAPGKRWSCDQTSAMDGFRTSKWVRLLSAPRPALTCDTRLRFSFVVIVFVWCDCAEADGDGLISWRGVCAVRKLADFRSSGSR